ncbi:MAG: DUF2066 domain-containing protein [Gammaproteobacteria bacterium]|nr:MAG: DUF2066 domain-containing protein [Gammaproteobacteria bacterium]
MKRLTARNLACLLLGLILVSTSVHAARLAGLFQAEVDADGRDSVSRDAALALALRDVLVRVTGSTSSANEPAAQALLKQPGRFVEQYRFLDAPARSPDPVPQVRLWVQFDGVALAREVRRAGLPYWGRERPDVLVWLAVDDRGQRYLVAENTRSAAAGERGQGYLAAENNSSAAAAALYRAASRRGLPLTLPLMDLQDQRAVQFTDVWGGFVGSLEAASQRYRPQIILLGKLERSRGGSGWRADWTLLGNGDTQSWTRYANGLGAGIDQGMAEAAEWLAVQYAAVTADASVRTLVVEGVQSLEDYARVLKYLASLAPVEAVQVARVSGQDVEFNLQLSAAEHNLLQVITLGKLLRPDGDPSLWRFQLNP